MSGPILQSKAKEFSTFLKVPNFEATNGSFDGFKKRHEIVFKNVCGESGTVDMNQASDWKNVLTEMIDQVNAKDIFNVDEAGLFFQCMPGKSLAFEGETYSGGKLNQIKKRG